MFYFGLNWFFSDIWNNGPDSPIWAHNLFPAQDLWSPKSPTPGLHGGPADTHLNSQQLQGVCLATGSWSADVTDVLESQGGRHSVTWSHKENGKACNAGMGRKIHLAGGHWVYGGVGWGAPLLESSPLPTSPPSFRVLTQLQPLTLGLVPWLLSFLASCVLGSQVFWVRAQELCLLTPK